MLQSGSLVGFLDAALREVHELPGGQLDGRRAEWGLVTDLNGDGLADVVLTVNVETNQEIPPQAWVYLSGDGGFALRTYAIDRDFNAHAAGGVTLGDLNRDGIPDLVTSLSGYYDESIMVWPGTGDGFFSETAQEGYVSGGGRNSAGSGIPAVLDVNGDGWPDVIEATTFGLALLVNDAGNDLSFGSLITQDTSGALLALADVNGDGLPDLVYQDSVGSLAWAENTGVGIDAGGYLWWPSIAPNLPTNLQAVFGLISLPASAFQSGGGERDGLAFSYGVPPYAGFCQLANLDDSQGPCQQWEGFDIPNGTLALADSIDGDGRPQVMVGGSRNGESWIEFGQVEASADIGSQATLGSFYETIADGDLNGDGFTDLIIFRSGGPWEGWINTCGPGAARTLAGSGSP